MFSHKLVACKSSVHKVCLDAYTSVLCSLLCRTFDSSLAEVCYEEGVGLLAYSPIAMGLLTVRP